MQLPPQEETPRVYSCTSFRRSSRRLPAMPGRRRSMRRPWRACRWAVLIAALVLTVCWPASAGKKWFVHFGAEPYFVTGLGSGRIKFLAAYSDRVRCYGHWPSLVFRGLDPSRLVHEFHCKDLGGLVVICIPLWTAPLAALGVALSELRARRRALPGQCPRCHYDLSGLPPGSPCPECAAVSPPGMRP